MSEKGKLKIFPLHGCIGLFLVVVFWILNWSLSGLRTQWGFFGLWLGYALTIDGIVYYKKATSLLTRNFKKYIGLFLISAPAWWLFEAFNQITNNWIYDGRQYFTNLQYFLLATLSFSTVMPAVFGTAEFAGTFKWIKNMKSGVQIKPSNSNIIKLFIAGIITLTLIIAFPDHFFYLIWISIYFLIEPVNILFKNKTLLDYTVNKDWRPIIALALGCLMCGFFWEMWNYYSYPKWIYHLPLVNFMHVFEMPVLGYIGYIPFSLELFALYHLVTGIILKDKNRDYIRLL